MPPYVFHFEVPLAHLPFLLQGAWVTLQVSFVAVCAGLAIGIAGAAFRTSGLPVLAAPATAYVEFVRNTPLLVQVFFFYFGLPDLGVDLDPLEASVLALSVNGGAYFTEIIRGGIESIPRGQIEASRSLGLTRPQVLRYVVLPQALRVVIPPIGNECLLLLLGSSVCSTVTLPELTYNAGILESRTFRSFETYLFTLGLYFAMAQLLATAVKLAGRQVELKEAQP